MHGRSILPDWLLTGRRRFLFLLIFLMVLLFLGPFLGRSSSGLSLFDALSTIVLILGAYSTSHRKTFLVAALVILVPAVVLVWLDHFDPTTSYALSRYILALLFYAFVDGAILRYVLTDERVTFDKISAALCVYLLLGLIFAIIYTLMEFLEPGTFLTGGQIIAQGDPGAFRGAGFGQAVYYSFTTLTTLGYGDITGATRAARNLSVLEAIIGQIYLVVLVAYLVGMQISHASKDKSS